MSSELFPLSPSLWAHTAMPAIPTPRLEEGARVDVAIVGAGYAGLSTALHLAERGVRVKVLEAREPGWGGSGRNGGQVIAGLKYDPDELDKKAGGDAGRALTAFAGSTTRHVFDLIERHGLDVPHSRTGWVQGAHNAQALKTVATRADQWRKRGVEGARVLDREETARLLGTTAYLGGWFDPRGGAVQPLSYARELARAAAAAGATIHGDTAVTGWRAEAGKWRVSTAHGPEVTANTVIVCTNGYTRELAPRIARTVIAPISYQVSTVPLPEEIGRTIMPGGYPSSDTRNLLLYFRRDHTGRFIMGGRGPFRQPRSANDWRHLEQTTVRMFPQLAGIAFDHRWCGHVAVTRDFLPHVHEPEKGLVINIGCQGRGVALETAMGAALAAYATSRDPRTLPFPLTRVQPIPFHGLQSLYLAAAIAWFRLRDSGVV
ncbi:MAG: NAD(P)/FAD-dependent oxidoreductase [Pseudochelatococcus sp.]|jgi:glycine/D-amino acid oxidase-like deaminating enzyme|uniref:NAD(P)/FAD-dependent oxidoreductase n=1 Tax=Pseudochelatococcus sp. TaxID=2020869 RepID=UPI003D8EC179